MKNKRIKILIALMVITAMAVTGFTVSYAEDGTQGNIIDRIELANDVKPVEGAVPAEPQVPEDALYSVEESGWVIVHGDMIDPVTGTFKAGKVYTLIVILASKEGCKLSETPAVPAPDGCIKTDYELLNEDTILVVYTFPLADENSISKVRLLDVDPPYLGEHPDYEYTLPEGAGYHVAPGKYGDRYQWHELDKDGMVSTSIGRTGVYKEEKLYRLEVDFEADEGEYFTVATTAEPLPGFDTVSASYDEETGLMHVEYSAFVKAGSPIEALDLTGLRIPEAGETPEDITIPENDKFSIVEKDWFRLDEDGNETDIGSGETFKAGETCGLILLIEPKSGYIFDENADVVPEALKEHIVFSDIGETSAFISMSFKIPEPEAPNGQTEPADPEDPTGSDQNVNDEGAADGDQAETGDESSVMPWILLMAGGLAGAAIILRNRRHN